MKKLIVFYSFSGHTKKLAEQAAKKNGADIIEITTKKKYSPLTAYTAGCLAALQGKQAELTQPPLFLAGYSDITIMGPVWAGHPAPAVNAVLSQLPAGKQVHMVMVSSSGKSKAKAKVEAVVSGKGSRLANYDDIKA